MGDILEGIKLYANRCISGEEISCKKHIWACMRFLSDLEKAESSLDYPYYWDEQEAQNIVEWFKLLRHSKGILAGKPIELTDWQKFRLCQLYGWRRRSNGRKRFRKSFTEVARKNAKSQEEAGVALYEISVMSTRNKELYEYYTAGVKRDQSKIVFNEAALMLKDTPLAMKFKVTKATIEHRKTGSFIKALSKEDGRRGDGTNPAGLIIDEYHQHPTSEFYDLGLGSNTKEPLLMVITTAGVNLSYPCYVTEYAYCSKILDPNSDVENDEYLVDICELDAEDYNIIQGLENREVWKKANPIRMSYPEGVEKIDSEYRIAIEQPEHMSAFLTKCMNVWVQAKDGGYMDMGKWKACEAEKIPINTRGFAVYVGFDMSAKIDLTSVAFIIPFMEGETVKYIVFSHSFIPNREKLAERIAVDKVPYDSWVRQGFLTVTDTPIVDQTAVMEYVFSECEKNDWKIQMLCMDPANAAKMMLDLSNEGYDVREVWQSHRALNEATQGFREQVYAGNIIYTKNPLLNYAMGNAVIRRNNGLIKIDKDASTKKIDPVDAVLCAYKLAMYHVFTNYREESLKRFLEGDW